MPDTHSFGPMAITAHAWNNNRSQVAISRNSTDVEVYKSGGQWPKVATLSEHGQQVTGIDWAPNSNTIVTCSADRNAYVWTQQPDGSWKANMVILRINRAATSVKWSPSETKFAVGSGSRLVAICYFEKENDFWVSKHIKKPIRSTVTCLDWHPNSVLLATGSCDFKARVFSAYIKEVESKPSATGWGQKMAFGTCMTEVTNPGYGWIHGVSFSPSGDQLAWVGHDSTVSILDSSNNNAVTTTKTSFLPFTCCTWVSDKSIVAGGHDCCPMLFSFDGSSVEFTKKLDSSSKDKGAGSGQLSARRIFQERDTRGQEAGTGGTKLETSHQNTISQISAHSGPRDRCAKFSTAGVDGSLAIWDVKSLEASIAGLKIK